MTQTNKRSAEPIWLNLKNLRKLLALLLSGFAIYTAAFGVQPDFIQTSVHLSLALILVFTLSVNESPTFIRSVYDWSGILEKGRVNYMTCSLIQTNWSIYGIQKNILPYVKIKKI